ncbi:MAG: DEAD/DEAH box helicase [Blautia sp.]|nr:DEAD/DEAH box helicase [Blautia sp.]MCM1200995.1 DEAD/DEAH box helicase [Bacteroides fragilis]
MKDCFTLFEAETAEWFRETLGEPTPVQKEAWPAIAEGGHVLVSAPTGTGKTLSAFLVFLNKMKKSAAEGRLKQELQLIYVSPLKSLAADIRENLKRPLAGIGGEGVITAAVRTGDTTAKERQQMIRKPPHILITTPESLYLLLTGKTGQNMLSTARAVILDELHALIDTKRGAHLMLSLARLDALCKKPLQRIGLSATISPLSEAAAYLAPEPVSIIAPAMEKGVELQILGSYAEPGRRRKDPVWQELSELVYRYCQGKRSVLAFVEGRRYAEKLAYYVNLIGGEDFARVHHGSLSREQRQETERLLREGSLRLLCATSSMELGIDVGEIDQVLQVGCPRTVSGTMQRLGRAGHNPFRTSVMYLFPRTAAESVLCGMTAELARRGLVEKVNPPEGCLDVLAQHLVSMAAFRSYTLDEVMEILPRAWPFRKLTKADVKAVLEMLAGDYEHKREAPVRPRVLYDRLHEKVEGDGYSRMLAISAGGTIPDKGLYTVRTEEGVKVGEADEEFVYETRKGDRFILGSFGWKVVHIGRDTVTVTQAPVEGARLPFWKGELKGRGKETGEAFGRILRSLQDAEENNRLEEALAGLGLDESASMLASGYLKRQIETTGMLPDDKTIIAEHFKDQSGNSQIMFHSVFGRRVNAPLSLLAAQLIKSGFGIEAGSVDEEDGFLLYSYGDKPLPEGVLERLDPERLEAFLSAMLPETPLFNAAFRYNCGRALMMGVRKNSRQPLWMQRIRSAEMMEQVIGEKDHPLIRETRQECMRQLWDVEGVRELLCGIRSGLIAVREIYTDTPSPMSLPLQWAQEAAVMYDYAPTPRRIHAAVEDALQQEKELLLPGEKELSQTGVREKLPSDEKQLHSLLMTEGDLAAGELDIPKAADTLGKSAPAGSLPAEWLEKLAAQGRALYLEQGLWIAAEQEAEYRAALEETEESGWQDTARHIVRRMLRYRGASSAAQTARRYGWKEADARAILETLCERQEAVLHEDVYYHAELYKRARARTLKNRREEIATCPAEAYAALLLSRIRRMEPPEEGIRAALPALTGIAVPAAFWEDALLPARVKNYRGKLLDDLLSAGEYFWHMEEGGKLSLEHTERIDWSREPEAVSVKSAEVFLKTLSEKERLLVETLSGRGASFIQTLGGALDGEPPYEILFSLMEKGIVNADSFEPVRLLMNRKKLEKSAVRQRVGARVKAFYTGRFDLVRPSCPLTVQEQMNACFDRYLILCRETAAAYGMSWQEALSLLRVQEYTGQVRRGYFVEGLSGAQFIRKEDFAGVTARLGRPGEDLLWLNAADPMQPWGKLLPHGKDRAFANVPGTAAAFCGGSPAVLFERQGRALRVFETERLSEILNLFAEDFRRGRIYPGRKRIIVADYPAEAVSALSGSGFKREMQDYVLYR